MMRLLFCGALLLQYAIALDTTIDLGYAKYRGKDNGDGTMRWAGMRYARSVDGMRFTAPQDPTDERDVVNATEYGPLCIGVHTKLKSKSGGRHSEDCLFINVFAPQKATKESRLPVYVFIQGGGFNTNGNANYNGADLIEAGDDNMVIVNFNYRVGPYGFLASSEIAANGSLGLNNGLKDQRQALKWVQKHIEEFGGDPSHVTIGGPSAGGGSVVFQLTAYGGRDDGLFHAAAAESPAFPPLRDVNNSQWQYKALLDQTGCADFACMTSLDAVKFQDAVRTLKKPFPGAKNPPIYFWNPTLDYDLIADYTLNELKAGHFINVPTIFGSSQHDGINFTPKGIKSLPSAQEFLIDQFPNLDWRPIREAWNVPADASGDAQWRTVTSDVYGNIRYNCPSLNITSTYSLNKSTPTWLYRWDVGTASHVGELMRIWYDGTNDTSTFIQSYWASFIRSYDPNKHAAEYINATGSGLEIPEWQAFSDTDGKRLEFNDNNNVTMETIPEEEWNRCNVIEEMGVHLKQPAYDPERQSFGIRQQPIASKYMVLAMAILGLFQWICV